MHRALRVNVSFGTLIRTVFITISLLSCAWIMPVSSADQMSKSRGVLQLSEQPTPTKVIATVRIPHSNGTVLFIDETPSAPEPAISIAIVEDSGFNTLKDLAVNQEVTPLEIYQAFALKITATPERLLQDHAIRRSSTRDTDQNDWSLVALPSISRSRGSVEADTWGDGCQDHAAWKSGFHNWVGFDQSKTIKHEVITNVVTNLSNTFSGHFYATDSHFLWLGVCVKQPEYFEANFNVLVTLYYQAEDSIVPIDINYNSDWPGPGPGVRLGQGQRFLYYNYTHSPRRHQVTVGVYDEAVVFLSGAVISTNAHPGDFIPE